MGCSDEKLRFFELNPELDRHTKIFAKTSIEREIQVLEDERQQKFTMFAQLIELGEEVYGGIQETSMLEKKLTQDFEIQKEYFKSMEEEIPNGAELFLVHIVIPAQSKGNFGYIALKDGLVVFDGTANLLQESKINFKESKRDGAVYKKAKRKGSNVENKHPNP